jgi:hypothetical protein
MNKRRRFRSGWILATLLPLWALWVYSWYSFKGMESWMERVPRHYGIHLYKQQLQGQLELFARVINLFENNVAQTRLEYLNQKYHRGEIDQMAVLFGLNMPVMVFQRDDFAILYPTRPAGPLATFLENSAARDDLVKALKRMVEKGDKEGYFSLPGSGTDPKTDDRHWYLSAAYSGGNLLCILLVDEASIQVSGDTLESTQGAWFRDRLRRYLLITLPVLALSSLMILLIALRGRLPGVSREQEKQA